MPSGYQFVSSVTTDESGGNILVPKEETQKLFLISISTIKKSNAPGGSIPGFFQQRGELNFIEV